MGRGYARCVDGEGQRERERERGGRERGRDAQEPLDAGVRVHDRVGVVRDVGDVVDVVLGPGREGLDEVEHARDARVPVRAHTVSPTPRARREEAEKAGRGRGKVNGGSAHPVVNRPQPTESWPVSFRPWVKTKLRAWKRARTPLSSMESPAARLVLTNAPSYASG